MSIILRRVRELGSMYQRKLDAIKRLIAYLVSEEIYPEKPAFADKVKAWLITNYGFSRRTINEYMEVLRVAYAQDKWKSLVENNEYITEEAMAKFQKRLKEIEKEEIEKDLSHLDALAKASRKGAEE